MSVLSLSFYKTFGLGENGSDNAKNGGWSDTELGG